MYSVIVVLICYVVEYEPFDLDSWFSNRLIHKSTENAGKVS